jgi:hypothetical protein
VALIGGLLMPFATSRQQGVRPSLPASKNNI